MDVNTKLQMYRTIHLAGLLTTFLAFGALATIAARGGEKRSKLPAIGHGVGLFLVLLGGFGLLAVKTKMGVIVGWPVWLILKLVLWTMLGAAVGIFKRKPEWTQATVAAGLAAGVVAVLLVTFKPFG